MRPLVLPLMVGLIAVGCGPTGPRAPVTYPVRGSVTVDGVPLSVGSIAFDGEDGTPPQSNDVRDGLFAFGVSAGTKKVAIRAYRKVEPPPPPPIDAEQNYIPPQYNSETTLKATVEPEGENEFHFTLVTR